jgi:hypothetical protein
VTTPTPQPEQARHTPGPWTVHADSYAGDHPNHASRFVGTQDFDEDASVGQIVAKLTDSPEIVANARLIAASPDLLAACEAFLREHDDTYDGGPISSGHVAAVELARAAIAKAKAGVA